jgi:hypothetical protein
MMVDIMRWDATNVRGVSISDRPINFCDQIQQRRPQ